MTTRARRTVASGRPGGRSRLAARRGAVTVMAGVFMIMMTMFAGIAIDATRLYTEKAQMQTAVDAAALAGTDQMLRDSSTAADSARAYLLRNGASTTTPVPDVLSVSEGVYTPQTGFIAGATPADAMVVGLERRVSFLVAQMLGSSGVLVSTRATAWSSAPVQSSNSCIKPIMLPMSYLRRVLDAPSSDLLPEDMRRLRELTQAERSDTFALGTPTSDLGHSYLQVRLPPVRRADGGTPETSQGDYYDYLGQCKSTKVSPSDWILIEPMVNAAQATVEGIRRVCEASVAEGGLGGTMTGGTCYVNGTATGVPLKVAFWDQAPTYPPFAGGFGAVQVKMLGSYTVTHVTEHGRDPSSGQSDLPPQANGTPPNRGTISGYLSLQRDFGPVNNSATSALRRVVLVE